MPHDAASAPLVSIIVPVYRAEATLDRCVTSVLAQQCPDWELLLVEDGSPDGSGALCDAWAARDPRIRAFHQPNGGASAARNLGLARARGRYLDFLDCDDSLTPDFLATALPWMEQQALDLLIFCLRRQSDGGAYTPQATGLFAGPQALRPQARALLLGSGLLDSPCNKLFRKSLVGSLRFDPALRVNEDVKFNLEYLPRCGPILVTDRCFYLQDDTIQGSLSRRMRGDYLDAEAATRPAFFGALQAMGCTPQEQQALAEARRVRACLIQFGVLTGRGGSLPAARQRALFGQILSDPAARTALLAQLKADPNRLGAAPLALCVGLGLPGLLTLLCRAKNQLLH